MSPVNVVEMYITTRHNALKNELSHVVQYCLLILNKLEEMTKQGHTPHTYWWLNGTEEVFH